MTWPRSSSCRLAAAHRHTADTHDRLQQQRGTGQAIAFIEPCLYYDFEPPTNGDVMVMITDH